MTEQARMAEVLAYYSRPSGRSAYLIRCPFCQVDTECRSWSLAGSGKRCECGAVLGRQHGVAIAVRR